MTPSVLRVSAAWRYGTVLLAAFVACAVAYLARTYAVEGGSSGDLVILGVGVAMFLFLAGAAVELFAERLYVGPDRLVLRNLTGVHEVPYSLCAGFRRSRSNAGPAVSIYFPDGRRAIEVGSFWSGYPEIAGWLAWRLTDLDAADARREDAEIARAEGAEVPSASGRIARLRALGRALTVVSLAVFLAMTAMPPRSGRGLELAVFAFGLLGVPAGILLKLRYPEEIDLEGAPKTQRAPGYFVLFALVAPAYGALFHYRMVRPAQALPAGLLLAALAWLGIVAARRRDAHRLSMALAYLFFCLGWGWGIAVCANAVLDPSPARAVATRVAGKRISAGRRTSDELWLAPFDGLTALTEIDVSRRLYDALAPGDAILVGVHGGRFGWHWVEGVAPRR